MDRCGGAVGRDERRRCQACERREASECAVQRREQAVEPWLGSGEHTAATFSRCDASPSPSIAAAVAVAAITSPSDHRPSLVPFDL